MHRPISIALLLLALIAGPGTLAQTASSPEATDTPAESLVRGRVLDAVTEAPIPGATVVLVGTPQGAATDADGRFEIDVSSHHRDGPHALRVSAVGFAPQTVMVEAGAPVEVALVAAVLPVREVVVTAQAAASSALTAPETFAEVEDLVARVPGAALMQRANFAQEPVVRGMQGGQLVLTVDGMRIYGACVDKMDPASSYVEVGNLARLEIAKGGFDLDGGAGLGGSVNLVTQGPRFDEHVWGEAEVGFGSAAAHRRVHVVGGGTTGRFAARASFGFRTANDFAAGGGATVAASGFSKNNTKLDLAVRLGRGHTLEAGYLADNAWDVGYPVLLMDATLATAQIGSLTHTWTRPDAGMSRGMGTMVHTANGLQQIETRLYANRVDHWMDDANRDVAARPVMRGMYMPMTGFTETWGLRSEAHLAWGRHMIDAALDVTRSTQFGDMAMYSIYPNIPDMYLLNVGDVTTDAAGLALTYDAPLPGRLSMRLAGRLDVEQRETGSAEMERILTGRWGLDDTRTVYVLPGASAVLGLRLGTATRLSASGALVQRAPTPVESHGHYVYNYTDGYFYTGNPTLGPEQSWQAEVAAEHTQRAGAVRLAAFVTHVNDAIVGESDDDVVPLANGSTYRFRVYTSARATRLVGGEASVRLDPVQSGPLQHLAVVASAAYTHGVRLDTREALPLIPPLSGTAAVRYGQAGTHVEVETRWAMPQERVAFVSAGENVTDGWALLNLRGRVALPAAWVPYASATLHLGVENALDTHYHDHLAVGDLPALGRNVTAALQLRF